MLLLKLEAVEWHFVVQSSRRRQRTEEGGGELSNGASASEPRGWTTSNPALSHGRRSRRQEGKSMGYRSHYYQTAWVRWRNKTSLALACQRNGSRRSVVALSFSSNDAQQWGAVRTR